MSQELTDAEWLRNFAKFIEEADGDEECDGSILADSEDSVRLRSIADRLERPGVEGEPVTAELLDRRGWLGSKHDKENHHFRCFEQNGFDFTFWWRNGELDDFTVSQEGGESQSLPFPATLHDLLNVLRVFGVDDSITPAAT